MSVMIMIVIVIIPIAIGAPAVLILIPPTTSVGPAIFARFAQFFPPVLGLFAVPSMMFRGFMKLVIGLNDATLAVITIGFDDWSAGQGHQADQYGATEHTFEEAPSFRIALTIHQPLLASAFSHAV